MQDMSIPPCPKCAGGRTYVYLSTYGGFQLEQPNKKGIFNKTSGVTPIVCLNCGYVELYAQNLQNLIPDR